jgi:hypothetical protein
MRHIPPVLIRIDGHSATPTSAVTCQTGSRIGWARRTARGPWIARRHAGAASVRTTLATMQRPCGCRLRPTLKEYILFSSMPVSSSSIMWGVAASSQPLGLCQSASACAHMGARHSSSSSSSSSSIAVHAAGQDVLLSNCSWCTRRAAHPAEIVLHTRAQRISTPSTAHFRTQLQLSCAKMRAAAALCVTAV